VAPSTRLLRAGLHRGWRVRRHPPDLLRRAAAKVVESSTNERAASLILGVSREHMDVYRWRPRGSCRALPHGRLRGPGYM